MGYLFPQFEAFGQDAQLWATCLLQIPFCGAAAGEDLDRLEDKDASAAGNTEISFILDNCERWRNFSGVGEGCGARPQSNPSHTIMIMSSLASSLLPSFISLAFTLKTIVAQVKNV